MSAQGAASGARDELEIASERGSDSKAYTVGAGWYRFARRRRFSLCWCPETGLERSRADYSWPALSG